MNKFMVTRGIKGMNQNQLIENMRKLIDELLENISHLKSENNRLKTENSYLKNKIEKTKAGIEEYAKKQIEKELAKIIKELNDEKALNATLTSKLNIDSTNSGTPTSQTPYGKQKRVPNTRQKTDKKKGGQKGHPANKLDKFADQEVTMTVDHKPEETRCDVCGSDLELYKIREKDEYVLNIRVEKVRHKFYEYKCPKCGKKFKIDIPLNLKEENQYNSSVQALAAILLNEGYVSMNRTKSIISGLTNGEIDMSEGFISKINTRLASVARQFYLELQLAVIRLKLMFWDDTYIRINGKNGIIRFYGNENLALYFAHEKKDTESVDDDGIKLLRGEDQFSMHDHNTINYNPKYKEQDAECGIHLIRRLKRILDDTKHEWCNDLIKLLVSANNQKKENEPIDLDKLRADYDDIIKRGREINKADKGNYLWERERSLLNDLEKYKENYLMFAAYDFIPFTNNLSERSLRPEKIKLSVSGQFANLERAEDHAVIRSYLETGKRHGYNIYELIVRALEGNYVTLEEMEEHASLAGG